MTLTAEDDFGGFVAARWPDLEAVATVATLDPPLARSVTIDALAALGRRWRRTVDDGAPTRAARSELLHRLVRLPAPDAPDSTAPSFEWDAHGPPTGERDPDASAMPGALRAALHDETPTDRAVFAAALVWEADAAEVANLAGLPADRVAPNLPATRGRLASAHRAARVADGLVPADWRLDDDLRQLVDAIVAAQPGPPDPAGLVADRQGRVQRRSLVAGVGAMAALGTAGWWLARGEVATGVEGGSSARPSSIGPTDSAWRSTAQWPARGALAGDLGLRSLVAGASGRLLWAEDVRGSRIVVAAVPPTSTGSTVRVWTGAAGTPASGLEPVTLTRNWIGGARDVVAVAAPGRSGSTLVVLARPTVEAAELSPVVRPTRRGTVERRWQTIALTGGVGTLDLETPLGPAARVRCDDYDGPPAGSPAERAVAPGPGDEVARLATAHVSLATGIPADRLRTRTVVDSRAGGDVVNGYGAAPARGDGRVWVTTTTTPDDAVVRAVYVRDDAGIGAAGQFWGPVTVAGPGDAEAPIVRRATDLGPKIARFLIVAPGAARARLRVTTPTGSSASEVTPMTEDAAIVVIVYNVADASSYHLDLWDAAGRRTYSAVPPLGTPLLDLG